jgi:hypothetical protein
MGTCYKILKGKIKTKTQNSRDIYLAGQLMKMVGLKLQAFLRESNMGVCM